MSQEILKELTKQPPTCIECGKAIWVEKNNFCFISKLEHSENKAKINTEFYHTECFISVAGAPIYDRISSKQKLKYTCYFCETKNNNEPMCLKCKEKINSKVSSSLKSSLLSSKEDCCVACKYNNTIHKNIPLCEKCYNHLFPTSQTF